MNSTAILKRLRIFLNGNQQRWCFSMLWYPIDIKNPIIDWLAVWSLFFFAMPYLLCEELFLKLTADFFFYKGSHGNFATCRINLRHKQRFRALFYRTPWNGDVTQRVVQKQKVKHIWMQIDPLSQKLITKHQWLVHMVSVILDTSKTVATEMEILFLYTWIMFPSLLPQIWKCIFLF